MASLSSHSTYGGEDLLRSGSGDSRVGERGELGPAAAPPVAWWLCTFDGPAQRPRNDIVSAALRGTSGHTAMKRRPSQGAPSGAERLGPRGEGPERRLFTTLSHYPLAEHKGGRLVAD